MKNLSHISFLGGILLGMLVLTAAGCRKDPLIGDDQIVFSRFYGGGNAEEAGDIIHNSGGEYLIAGSSQSFSNGGWDLFLLKTDANGNEIWRKNYGGTENEKGSSLLGLPDGGFFVIGEKENQAGLADLWLLRVDQDGDTLWTRTYGLPTRDERGAKIIPTVDGGFAMLGQQSLSEGSPADLWLGKIDSTGNLEWAFDYGFTGMDVPVDLHQDASGNYFMLATTDRTGENKMMIAKADEEGNDLWYLNFGPAGNVVANGWDWDQSGIYLTGTWVESQNSALVIRLDDAFFPVWTYTGETGTEGSAAAFTPDGNVALAGNIEGIPAQNTRLFLEKISFNGNSQNDLIEFGGSQTIEKVRRMLVNGDGTLTLCGTTDFEDNSMIWVVKINPG
ncbi:MAG: hypothetical protein H6581_13705 [Bacteroidia bacterium]|nr:hypothetical protein [Bacteroidia bacterium]